MKKPRRRTPAHRVNRKQKALAIKALSEIVQSDAQPYVKAKAAAALLNNGREPADGLPERDPNEPRKLVVLPDKGNDPGVRFGIYEPDQLVAIVPAECYGDPVMPEEFYAAYPKPAGTPVRLRAALARGDRQ